MADGGLDLETFLILSRTDLGMWASIGVGTLAMGLLVWSCWGSRRALRKCVALSVAAHAGLALYGSTVPSLYRSIGMRGRDAAEDDRHIRRIRVAPVSSADGREPASGRPEVGPAPSASSRPPDLVLEPLALASALPAEARQEGLRARETPGPDLSPSSEPSPHAPVPIARATPAVAIPATTSSPEARAAPAPAEPAVASAAPTAIAPGDVTQYAPPVEKLKAAPTPGRSAIPASAIAALPRAELRREGGRGRPAAGVLADPPGGRTTPAASPPIPLPRAIPNASRSSEPAPLADLTGSPGAKGLAAVPEIYRSRLDANRSALAQRAGATTASEQAVERALDWLARHQDSDGRWDGGTARYDDGGTVAGDDDFTAHCPAGETCFGECAYWDADTALTGLALLTYLGAGYTHRDGKHVSTVAKGIDFLTSSQKPDGDLRGPSRAVGMYCHAMATLALCEAYALSLDERLRGPAERAIGFLVRARAADRMAWRYAPGAPVGDTSILGWVVMALKSARETGLSVPDQAGVGRGALAWLDRVAAGNEGGLARYQPGEPVTSTMTAEAWVCRQFLGVGGPGAASDEAASHLLLHASDRGDSNFYYWYYGTLAMYQHGGPSWARWNARVRDRIVQLQRKSGHISGSWDPDESLYGPRGGRIYGTALAALTLEVYYRYLRLYDRPDLPADDTAAGDDGPQLEGPSPRR
ncbi:hypothetical protein OJF2_58050 [Aquisphaera giovannonii]|uniref:Prenyltransferase and squalene oxidase repeat protein n=1 Tax=Aquisphaera giovannonii TaxID=406548 RepID=A0A5B9W9A9_9BACT|nr:hypothetical protein OJF2_58050 [Aquisphaera giovannonii]